MRQTLIAYLSGPTADLVPLSARSQIQIDAEAQQEAIDAITGASERNIKKGDHVTLEYQLMKTGLAEPFATKSASAKAGENGEVLGAVRSLTAAE